MDDRQLGGIADQPLGRPEHDSQARNAVDVRLSCSDERADAFRKCGTVTSSPHFGPSTPTECPGAALEEKCGVSFPRTVEGVSTDGGPFMSHIVCPPATCLPPDRIVINSVQAGYRSGPASVRRLDAPTRGLSRRERSGRPACGGRHRTQLPEHPAASWSGRSRPK